ncbi:peroxide stress protein YaaA [Armatimonas sp.]|uniref:YaaA family protein n=1 Tax=Armatimonas sp. TaxID=1872638 RepID=UPI00286B09EC|nr:peroxide stress protein YaaA [Armatimonas sp.]
MRILLPPSEGKTSLPKGSPVDLTKLIFPELKAPRQQLLDTLTTLCNNEPQQALRVLGLTENQTDEVIRNQGLWSAPTAPAWQVYTGVLYGQLDTATLTKAQRQKLTDSVWIASALFGFVGFADLIPAYRLSGDTTLPQIGGLAGFWRDSLTPLLASDPELLLDLRSGSYVKLGPLPVGVAERAITVRVLQKMPSGAPKLIMHFNKATKGRIVRAIAQYRGTLRTARELAQLVATLGADVELLPLTKPGQAQQLEIVLPNLG